MKLWAQLLWCQVGTVVKDDAFGKQSLLLAGGSVWRLFSAPSLATWHDWHLDQLEATLIKLLGVILRLQVPRRLLEDVLLFSLKLSVTG